MGMRCREILPWLTSANTLWAVWLNGHNVRLSWKVSLANQALWLLFIIAFGAWGLLPLTLSLASIFASHLTRSRKPTGASDVQAVRPVVVRGAPTPAACIPHDARRSYRDLGRMAHQTSWKSGASGVDITE